MKRKDIWNVRFEDQSVIQVDAKSQNDAIEIARQTISDMYRYDFNKCRLAGGRILGVWR